MKEIIWTKWRQVSILIAGTVLALFPTILGLFTEVSSAINWIFYITTGLIGLFFIFSKWVIPRLNKPKEEKKVQVIYIDDAIKIAKEKAKTYGYQLEIKNSQTINEGDAQATTPILLVQGEDYYDNDDFVYLVNAYEPRNCSVLTELTDETIEKAGKHLATSPEKIREKLIMREDEERGTTTTILTKDPIIEEKQEEEEKKGYSK